MQSKIDSALFPSSIIHSFYTFLFMHPFFCIHLGTLREREREKEGVFPPGPNLFEEKGRPSLIVSFKGQNNSTLIYTNKFKHIS